MLNKLEGNLVFTTIKKAKLEHTKLINPYIQSEISADGYFLYVPENFNVNDFLELKFSFAMLNENICGELYLGGQKIDLILPNDESKFCNIIVCAHNSNFRIFTNFFNGKMPAKKLAFSTDIFLQKNSNLEYVRLISKNIQNELSADLNITQESNSKMKYRAFNFNENKFTEKMKNTLLEEGAFFDAAILTKAQNNGEVNIDADVLHLIGNTKSEILIKSIAADNAHIFVRGHVFVEKNVKDIAANLQTRSLLLSDLASIEMLPELEVYADDVKCNHGATFGCLSQEALFYLKSRGIPESLAYKMLLDAFSNEVIDKVCDKNLRAKLWQN